MLFIVDSKRKNTKLVFGNNKFTFFIPLIKYDFLLSKKYEGRPQNKE